MALDIGTRVGVYEVTAVSANFPTWLARTWIVAC